MCGLFGCYNPKGIDDAGLEIFNRLGKLSERRGRDSAGLISVERSRNKKRKTFIVRSRKALGTASKFLHSLNARLLTEAEPFLLAGHTRMATHGTVNLHNAHPFEIGHLVGMHNGVYSGLYDRANDKTDSRVIFEMLNKMGVPRGLRTINEEHHGYMALSFVNKSDQTLNLFSNGGRSLFLGQTKGLWCWASEEGFLRSVAKKWDYLGEVPENTLVACKLGTPKWKVTQYEYKKKVSFLPPPKKEDGEIPFEPDPQPSYELDGHFDSPHPSSDIYRRKIEVIGATKPVLKYRTGPNSLLTMDAARAIVQSHGCSLCIKKEHTLIHKKLYFFAPTRYICEDCHSSDELIKQFFNDTDFHMGTFILPSGKEYTGSK